MSNPVQSITITLPNESYDVIVGRGILAEVGSYLSLSRRVLVLTDSGVPAAYAKAVAEAAAAPLLITLPEGEGIKSFAVMEEVCRRMLAAGFGRGDCVVAVGGGVIGDLGGFIAASYMRGIDFYNLPTTLLAQVDSSIGGKVAINLDGIKNAIGAFYQPRRVLIDPDVLSTLPPRLLRAGMAEAVKMAISFDKELFALFERGEWKERLDEVILRSLDIKRRVVEQDEKERGLRRALNFGHTLGHGVESVYGIDADRREADGLYHGECVALGMLPMCTDEVRRRLLPVLRALSLPTEVTVEPDRLREAVCHDKKAERDGVTAVFVEAVGGFTLRQVTVEELLSRFSAAFAPSH